MTKEITHVTIDRYRNLQALFDDAMRRRDHYRKALEAIKAHIENNVKGMPRLSTTWMIADNALRGTHKEDEQ